MTAAEGNRPERSGPFTAFLMLACAGLSVLVVLLAIQNLRLKNEIARLASGLPEDALAQGETFGPMSLIDWDEQSRPLEFGEGEQRTLVLIFSTHCGACEQTFPIWDEILGGVDADASGVRVVGVQTDAPAEGDGDPSELVTESFPFPVFPVDYSQSAIMNRIPAVPVTVVVDTAGVVEEIWYGVPDGDTVDDIRSTLGW